MTYRPGLDGLRALAVAGVLASHTDVPGLHWAGGVGVVVFFALSGFLITTLLVEEHEESGRIRLMAFYRRRARRLFPALVVLLAFWLVVGALAGDRHVASVVAGVSYVLNWWRASGADFGGLNHLWSLAIEEQFYLLWPVVMLALLVLFSKRTVLAVTVGLAFVPVLLRLAWLDDPNVYYQSHTRADGLLVGCAFGLAYGWGARWQPPSAVVVAACAVLAGFVPVTDQRLLHGLGLAAVPLATMVVVLRVIERPGWLAQPTLRYLGRVSYGVYLWHYPLLRTTERWLPHGTAWTITSIILTISAAVLSYELVERRFLQPQISAQPTLRMSTSV